MDLHSQSWEYASEMVLKSVRMDLRTAEVPVRFLKDEKGRLSHHKRAGWFSPWHARGSPQSHVRVWGGLFPLPARIVVAVRRACADAASESAVPFASDLSRFLCTGCCWD
jgi:hypothetical protein